MVWFHTDYYLTHLYFRFLFQIVAEALTEYLKLVSDIFNFLTLQTLNTLCICNEIKVIIKTLQHMPIVSPYLYQLTCTEIRQHLRFKPVSVLNK